MDLEAFIAKVFCELDPTAAAEFAGPERAMLKAAMRRCKMARYPPVRGRADGEYASVKMVCRICGQSYVSHPMDWRVIGYSGRPFLHVLCDGSRVKL